MQNLIISSKGEVITILYQRILTESQRLEEQINAIQQQLKEFPEGNLICARDGKYHKWYQSNQQTRTYIPKHNQKLAQELATKKYLELLQKDLFQEKEALDAYLKRHTSDSGCAIQLLTDNPEYKELLNPFFTPTSQELLDWQSAPHECNKNYPEQLNIKATSGKFVRSKSEALIDMALYKNKIPFRYECPLQLGKITLYPDFTIRHPQTGSLYYWEHFGLMDDPRYRKKAIAFSHLPVQSSQQKQQKGSRPELISLARSLIS